MARVPLTTGRALSPYLGWKHWHHWGGLVFGAITLTWMLSGWLYLNPGGNRSGPLETITTMSPYNIGGIRADQSSRPEQALALSGGPLDPGLFTTAFADAWGEIAAAAPPKEVELVRVGGAPYFVAYEAWDKSWILPADRHAPARERFETGELTRLGARMVPGHHLVEATRVDRYDAYYYSVGAVAPKRLPVLRLTFDDPPRTWFYVDPHTGSIIRRYDRYGRVMRWAVNGLHSLDVPLLFRHGRAWDVTVIGLSAGGLLLSVIGDRDRLAAVAMACVTANMRSTGGMMRIRRRHISRAYCCNLALLTALALSNGAVTFAQQPPAGPPGAPRSRLEVPLESHRTLFIGNSTTTKTSHGRPFAVWMQRPALCAASLSVTLEVKPV